MARRFSRSVFSSTLSCRCIRGASPARDPGVKFAGVDIGNQSGDGDRAGRLKPCEAMIDQRFSVIRAIWLDSLRGTLSESFIVPLVPLLFPPGLHSRILQLILQSIQLLLHFRDALLEIRFLDDAQLQMEQWRQPGRGSRMQLAGVDVRDQSFDRVAQCRHALQIRQRIRSGRDAAVLPSADPAKFYSLLGVGVEKTESTRSRSVVAGLPALRRALQRES